ncbi:MAG TPA: type IX secretion system membrane protein PorP/SprF [Chryseosolibacter sp.]
MARKSFLLLVSMLLVLSSEAQQQATFAQYMFNGVAINPAYAGEHKALSISVLSRFQNIGLPGAPTTQSLAIHSPMVDQRFSVGALVVHDRIGVIDQTGVNGIYSYRIPVADHVSLSMALQAGYSFYRANYAQLDTYQPDPVFAQNVAQNRPNIGAGAFLSKQQTWYVGLSSPHLMNNVFTRGAELTTIRQNVPLILSAGYVLSISRKLKFKPNTLFKMVDNRPVEFDLNANFLVDEVLWLGASYRSSKSMNFMTEIQVTDQLRIGYSYIVALGPIRQVEIGSHEFFVGYILSYKMKGIVSPRYF